MIETKETNTARMHRLEKEGGPPLQQFIHILRMYNASLPVVNDDPLIQARYIAHRLDGDSHRWSDMMAHQQPPGARTDREFLRGHCSGNQFEDTPHIGELYKKRAAAAGVDITGKVYYGTLAEYPGDPEAWVSGRGDVQRLCERKGWGCEGAVNVKMRERENPPPKIAVAPDIVAAEVEKRMEHLHPADAARVDIGEVAHQVTEQLKPHWAE